MKIQTFVSEILLYVFLTSPGVTFPTDIAPFARPCPQLDQTELTETNAEHSYAECQSPESDKFEVWNVPEKGPKREQDGPKVKPRLKIRDFYECHTGNSDVTGCDSNPDRPSCPDGSRPITRQVLALDGEFIRQFSVCPGDPLPEDIPEESYIDEPRITLEAFRSFPIKGSTVRSTPTTFSLRNGYSHFWASQETQLFDSNLSGAEIKIKAIPIQWNWNYGDGTTRNLSFPGEPMPHHTLRDETPTSHSYGETGTFKVGVTTLYRGEFSVDGGAWQAIPGQAAVASVPIEIDVWRTEKELIANE
ncbi:MULTISPECIES: hypothetical protein [unclassified Glutamicibacter]|uniref:hypothetical protein n=1 Tax=unclassified Glutamicibacter TaxID=2627139 RepID=UPI0038241311